MKRVLEILFLSVIVAISLSCNIDEEITTALPPRILADTKTSYRLKVGDELRLAPNVENDDEASFSWSVEGREVSTERAYIFVAESVGRVCVTFCITTTSGEAKQDYTIDVIDSFKVYDYTPAPGQFINELKTGGFDGTESTAESAIAYAERRLTDGNWVSLGGFGGYIIMGLDHSIANGEGADFAIMCNAFDGSSEPGVVWVMQDENGDGEPNDIWYELAGSETGKVETLQNYEVTYSRPSGVAMSVEWVDNQGNSGVIPYMKEFHSQECYYPLWVTEDSYTLAGTLLKARNYDSMGNGAMWVNPHYDWGYVDNASPEDYVTAERANHLDIANAVDSQGSAVELEYVDFVKVQCAVQATSGWLGELSTEVCGFYDYNMTK